MTEIILASTSPARRALLEQTKLKFSVAPSNFDETQFRSNNPEELVRYLAAGKARAVAKQKTDAIVIGADTIIYHDNKIIEKPKDAIEAFNFIKSYCGIKHRVYTGIAVIKGAKEITDVMCAEVTFRKLDDEEIRAYVQTGEPFGNSGAYTSDKCGAALIEKIEGDYHSVTGLPLFRLFSILREFGIKPLDFMK